MTWPQPIQTNTRQTDSTTDAAEPVQQTLHPPVGSAPWPVWDLIATGPLMLMLWLMIAADVIFAGLRATAILGLPYLGLLLHSSSA